MDETNDTGKKGKVTSLNEVRERKRREKAERDPKPTKAELYRAVIHAFNRTNCRLLPEPRVKLKVIEPSQGTRQIILIAEDDSCSIVPLAFVVAELAYYLGSAVVGIEEYVWEHRHILECAKLWLVSTPPIETPKPMRFRTEKGLCFHRLPFDLAQGPTPAFDELFSRMTNARAVKAFIGSLFVEEADRQQYCFLYGPGNDGKGSLARLLMRVFGPAAETQSALPRINNKHWAVPYEGKRLVVFPDFDDYESMTSGQLKSLTGDDAVYVERKYQEGYTTKLVCKMLFCSNKMPSISSLKADQRRIIFSELQTTAKHDSQYGARLWAEAGAFLWECVTAYGEVAPKHETIPLADDEEDSSHAWGAVYDQEFEYVFNTFFAKLHRNNMTENEFRLSWADPHEVQKRLNFYWPGKRGNQLAFLNWMREQGYHRKKVRVVLDGDHLRLWKYAGLGIAGGSEFDPKSVAEVDL